MSGEQEISIKILLWEQVSAPKHGGIANLKSPTIFHREQGHTLSHCSIQSILMAGRQEVSHLLAHNFLSIVANEIFQLGSGLRAVLVLLQVACSAFAPAFYLYAEFWAGQETQEDSTSPASSEGISSHQVPFSDQGDSPASAHSADFTPSLFAGHTNDTFPRDIWYNNLIFASENCRGAN